MEAVKNLSNVMANKAKISVLIPYKIENGQVKVFMQRRAVDAVNSPDKFGFFGGHHELGETTEQALEREIEEELNLKITGYHFLTVYETKKHFKYVFYLKVSDNFEDEIKISEGQYGKFMTEEEIDAEPEMIEHDRPALKEFFREINGK